MSNSISFAGDGEMDTSRNVSSAQPERGSRGSQGPIDMTGNGAQDAGGTLNYTQPRGEMPKGGGIDMTGNGGEDA